MHVVPFWEGFSQDKWQRKIVNGCIIEEGTLWISIEFL